MKVSRKNLTAEIAPNSPPLLLKRIISDGFDIVTLFFLFVLITFIIMRTPLAGEYNRHLDTCRTIQQETVDAAGGNMEIVKQKLAENAAYNDELFAANLHGFLLKTLAGAVSEAILYLLIPLLNADGATLGRKMTGILLFDPRRQAKARWYQLLGRFALIFTFESFALYFWTGIYTFLFVPLLRITVIMLNRNNRTLCDYMTSTMLIEKVSYSPIH